MSRHGNITRISRRKKGGRHMAKGRTVPSLPETVISIIGPGMRITGDCESTDTIRVEGVVEGSVRAKKAIVVGKGGRVVGDITTADAKIAGTVHGALEIASRLELAATSVIDGKIRAARMQLAEGGVVNGSVKIGRDDAPKAENGGPKGKVAGRSAAKGKPTAGAVRAKGK